MRDRVTVAELLVRSVGVAGAQAASVLAGDWTDCVAVVPNAAEEFMMRRRVELLRQPSAGRDAQLNAGDGRRVRVVMTPEEALALEGLHSVSLLVLDMLGRRPKEGFSVGALLRAVASDARIFAAVPSAWLHSSAAAADRAALLAEARLRTVVDLGRPPVQREDKFSRSGVVPHFPVALVHLERSTSFAGSTYLASLPAGTSLTTPALERFLSSLGDVRPLGERTEWGFFADVRRDDVWDPAWLLPERQETDCRLA